VSGVAGIKNGLLKLPLILIATKYIYILFATTDKNVKD
jgi:hypothetical protein